MAERLMVLPIPRKGMQALRRPAASNAFCELPNQTFRRNLTASYLAPFIVMGILAGILLWRIQKQIAVSDQVERSDQIILGANNAALAFRDLQVALRSYIIEPDKQYLAQLQNAQEILAAAVERLAPLVSNNPSEERHLLRVSDLKGRWVKEAETLIRQRDRDISDIEGVAEAHTTGAAILNSLGDLASTENLLRQLRVARQRSDDQLVTVLVPVLCLLVAAFLGYWGWWQIRSASLEFTGALTAADEARAKAEQANRAKDRFLGTVSHELRNPLNSIMIWSATLQADKTLSEKTARGLTAIEKAVRAQTQLIEDLLDIARIESGRLRLDVKTVDLNEVVRSAVENMRAAADAKSISLQTTIDSQVPFLAGDPGRLQQVIWNLVSNAVKFTPRGGKVQVRVARVDSQIEIVVADTGCGIEAGSLGLVFDRFWQAETTGQTNHGVGLGLSIVKEIATLHGGTVIAESEGLGKGTAFTVRLPLPATSMEPEQLHRRRTLASSTELATARRLDGLSILVVDDDPDAREALRNLLGSLGASVTAEPSADAALAKLVKLRPDIIVSDIVMRLHDGFYLARELRKREQSANKKHPVPLVALTAYGRVEDRVKILAAGFDSHAVKPVEPAELSTLLGTLVASREHD
jgi:signal transduction histidine kinase/ActR/RegA family two-component response regulator